ncbi:DUF3617 domain-containing protein [Sphingomicrobium clamense]|uniref:DUF3617 domain-containing protein n=1 Tax=Sphingomicrobium clamense TaxID=2851013 RepID=A0ABS6V3W0_9SPHN|nr:DUF3617 domain-containing protein [Sphingomicrobium sp. B8]MBW0144241.1 DUF3617 domain-containing protein [Sphingomicrobium sp. B8]
MRTMILMTGCLALVACGESGSVDADGDGTITNDEVMAATADMAKPVPGRWEVTTEVIEMNIPGMPPEMKDLAKTMFAGAGINYCLTAEEAEQDPEALWKETNGDCSWETFEMDGDSVNAKAVCKGQGGETMRMTMSGTHTPTSYSSDNEMQMQTPQGDGLIKMHVEGRHVGECDGSEMG